MEKDCIANWLARRKRGGEWPECRFARIADLARSTSEAASFADLIRKFTTRSVGAASAQNTWSARLNCACIIEEPWARAELLRFHH